MVEVNVLSGLCFTILLGLSLCVSCISGVSAPWSIGSAQTCTSSRRTHSIGPERQLCCQGSTNDVVSKRYVGKLTGNDENMNPCDANLFADYKVDITRAVAYTSKTDETSPPELQAEKYSLSRAKDVRETMLRVWKCKWSPTPERIVQDISRWPKTIKRIIDAQGAKLPKKACGKQRCAHEFKPPPDCPATRAAEMARFRVLDPVQGPPKKRPRE